MLSHPTAQQISQRPQQRRFNLTWWRGLGAISLLLALGAGYQLTGQPVTLVINGQPYPIRTHRLEVAAIIQATGLTLQPEDRVQPLLDNQLAPGETLTIQLARPVSIEADGRIWRLLTHQPTVGEALAEAGLITNPRQDFG